MTKEAPGGLCYLMTSSKGTKGVAVVVIVVGLNAVTGLKAQRAILEFLLLLLLIRSPAGKRHPVGR